MSNSRKRRGGKSHGRGQRSSPAGSFPDELRPWLSAMVLADQAEARGDAAEALGILTARPLGPDGNPFWRPWRIVRLTQLYLFESLLPRWATSRWIMAQAMQSLEPESRGGVHQAMRIAVELRGGEETLPGVDQADARARVIDHDWVFRQSFLYELGGLTRFLRREATPDLVAGADRIQEWARATMGGYRLVRSEPGQVIWEDLGDHEELCVPNIGGAALVMPGECVIGRLVPTEHGEMFESMPLQVPARAALRVADDPAGWIEALRAERCEGEELHTTSGSTDLLSDVPRPIWQYALLSGNPQPSTPIASTADRLAAATLRVARQAIDRPRNFSGGDKLDVWACLSAALLDPAVLVAMDERMTSADVELLHRLATLLAEPAATVCRQASDDPLAA